MAPFFILSATSPVAAQGTELDGYALVVGLFGGLALMLFGMDQMADALKAMAGERMRTVLASLTRNRLAGVFTGAFITAVIQSSSITTVLVVGFVTAGLMTTAQSVGVIMGANIGSTVTAQIIAFKVTKLALLMIAVGFAVQFTAARERMRQYGSVVMGLGMVFFGMTVMGDAMTPLRTFPPFLDAMQSMANPLLGIAVGAAFTALVQSSAATTGIVIVMAGQGLIVLPAGIALAFGANIGTCATALLAALGKPREAMRAAVVHVLFNVFGVLIWLPFIGGLARIVEGISPSDAPRQIANAHSIFNIANTFLFIGFAPQFARWVVWLVPERPEDEEAEVRAKYLDQELLATPSLALDRARLELLNMGDRVREMLRIALPTVLHGEREDLEALRDMDDAVDGLHGHIATYLGHISQQELTEGQTSELIKILGAVNELENIGDIIETNLVEQGFQRLRDGFSVSEGTREVIEGFHRVVSRALDASLHAVTQKNADAARVVVEMKQEINRLAASAALHESQRLVASEPHRLPAYKMEIDLLENLKRIYYFTKRIARGILAESG